MPITLHRILEQPCKKCGGKRIECEITDFSGTAVDYYYTFKHTCLNCSDSVQESSHIGYGQESEKDQNCPFCSYDWTNDLNEAERKSRNQ